MIQYRFGIWYLKCDDIWIANFLNQEDNESETERVKSDKVQEVCDTQIIPVNSEGKSWGWAVPSSDKFS